MGKKREIYLEFLEVSKQTGVPVKKVLDIFWYLSKSEAVRNNKLIQKVGVSKNAINQVKKALSVYLKPSTMKTSLKQEAAKGLGELYKNNYLVEESLLKVLVENNLYKQLVEILSRHKDKKPSPKRKYDQFTATVETTAKRAALLDFLGDVKSKRVLFLGDDDFTSVAISSMKSAQEIVVVDIDEEILNNIGRISNKIGFGIRTVKHDLRISLPVWLRNKFDTVFTDPPYTPAGVKLFVSRALEAIDKKNQTARVYACYGNSDRAKERFLPIQDIFTKSGLMLRYIFNRFNRYEGAESIGSSSSLYVGEITPKTKPQIKGNYDELIYTID